jgi:hypothetical protein
LKKSALIVCILVLLSTTLVACGGGSEPVTNRTPIRQQQLSETGLFGRHNVDGVTTEDGLSGSLSGGYFLFAASTSGSISPTTNYTIMWQPTPGEYVYTTLPRSIFRVKLEDIDNPQMEIVFKDLWLNESPSIYDMDANGNRLGMEPVDGIEYQSSYLKGTKLNLNNFILPSNIDIIYIYISQDDLKIPENVSP